MSVPCGDPALRPRRAAVLPVAAAALLALAACGGGGDGGGGRQPGETASAATGRILASIDLAAVRAPANPPAVGLYPAASARIEGWISATQDDSIRAHAWDTWASITSPVGPGGLPVWETWYSGHEVYEMVPDSVRGARRHFRDFEHPEQFHTVGLHVSRGRQRIPTDRAEAVLSFNRYTRSLAEYIWNHRYNDSTVLDSINDAFDRAGTPVAERQILVSRDSVDASEIALKPVFQFISGSGPTAIPYWNGDSPAASTDSANPSPSTWRQGVVVDPTGKLKPGDTVSMSVNGGPPQPLPVVSLDLFYHVRVTAADSANYSNFAATSGDEVGASDSGAQDSVLAMVRPGNYALLMAMHVTTKEIPNWTWQTFWWSPNPQDPQYGADRTAAVRGVWRNYNMNAAYYMVTPPGRRGGTPHVVYNPYLETNLYGKVPNPAGGDSIAWTGVTSNCMSCHRVASWPGQIYYPNGQIAPGDSAIFGGLTKLDFLWSVTRAQ